MEDTKVFPTIDQMYDSWIRRMEKPRSRMLAYGETPTDAKRLKPITAAARVWVERFVKYCKLRLEQIGPEPLKSETFKARRLRKNGKVVRLKVGE